MSNDNFSKAKATAASKNYNYQLGSAGTRHEEEKRPPTSGLGVNYSYDSNQQANNQIPNSYRNRNSRDNFNSTQDRH